MNENNYEKLVFETEEGQESFYVLDDTRINGVNYLLVTNSDDPEAEEIDVLFFKEISTDGETETVYEIVTDEEEIIAIAPLFEETIGDNIEV